MNILIDANTLYQKECGSKTYTYNIIKEFLIIKNSRNSLNSTNNTNDTNDTNDTKNKSIADILNIDTDTATDAGNIINIDICDISGNILSLENTEQLNERMIKSNQKSFLTKLKKSVPQDSFFYPYIKSFYRNIKKNVNRININSAHKKGKVYDIFFTPYQMEIAADIARYKFITIHDIYALTHPENYLTETYTASFKKYLKDYLKYFNAVLTVSEFTKNEIAEYFNYPENKIFVVRGAFNSENYKKIRDAKTIYGRLVSAETAINTDTAYLNNINNTNSINNINIIKQFKEKYGLNKHYILYVGVIEPRKNIINLLRAYKELQTCSNIECNVNNASLDMKNKNFNLDLILVSGSSALAGDIFKLIEELKSNVKVFKNVNNEDLNLFYNCADLFIFPSLYEGFGIPPLEAFACGTPVAASNATAIPEICGNGAYYFNPRSIDSIKDAVLNILKSPSLQSELIKNGLEKAEMYSFKNSALELMGIFNKFL